MTETPGDSAPAKSTRVPVDSFAHRLMLARAHAGHLSIRVAAELCGFGRGAWTNWEKGAEPTEKDYIVEVVSEKLNVDPVWLSEGGALAEPETRSRRRRWSTVRPTHDRASEGGQATVANLSLPGRRPELPIRTMPGRPRDNRPSGRPTRTAPAPNTRRPVRL